MLPLLLLALVLPYVRCDTAWVILMTRDVQLPLEDNQIYSTNLLDGTTQTTTDEHLKKTMELDTSPLPLLELELELLP
jgi:hypothetical protein